MLSKAKSGNALSTRQRRPGFRWRSTRATRVRDSAWDTAVIPITTFAGKRVAVFGLGGSGMVAASALALGRAVVVGWDDSQDRIAHAASKGFSVKDLRELDWSGIAALVLAPGGPLNHPAPHWSVGLARAATVEAIGDIELFCRARRAHPPQAPFLAFTATTSNSTTPAPPAHLSPHPRLP